MIPISLSHTRNNQRSTLEFSDDNNMKGKGHPLFISETNPLPTHTPAPTPTHTLYRHYSLYIIRLDCDSNLLDLLQR